MQQRQFGQTSMMVSEVGFGGWGIGGESYGRSDPDVALRALAAAEELGCNFVDTAGVYGDSESILGRFLEGRRSRWLIGSKYSGQAQGLWATLREQLDRLRIDYIDFYQLHWMPGRDERGLLDELQRARESGLVRYIGVSLYSVVDIDAVLEDDRIDGFQVAFSLVQPLPFLARIDAVAQRGVAVIARSPLNSGFLAGGYGTESRFRDDRDQRSRWSGHRIAHAANATGRFRFLEMKAESILAQAIRYPLSFREVSTVIVGTKTPAQAAENFGLAPGRLSDAMLRNVEEAQREMGLLSGPWGHRARKWLGRWKRLWK